jgi:hypothetical protein
MAEVSRRAMASRSSLPNVRFVAAGVTQLPVELDALADTVTVRFPWGSLLHGALGEDAPTAASIARLVAVGGRLELTLSLVERDRPAGIDRPPFGDADLDRMRTAFSALGLELDEACQLTIAEVATTGSTWARRLRAGGPDRPVWRVAFTRRGSGPLG